MLLPEFSEAPQGLFLWFSLYKEQNEAQKVEQLGQVGGGPGRNR